MNASNENLSSYKYIRILWDFQDPISIELFMVRSDNITRIRWCCLHRTDLFCDNLFVYWDFCVYEGFHQRHQRYIWASRSTYYVQTIRINDVRKLQKSYRSSQSNLRVSGFLNPISILILPLIFGVPHSARLMHRFANTAHLMILVLVGSYALAISSSLLIILKVIW